MPSLSDLSDPIAPFVFCLVKRAIGAINQRHNPRMPAIVSNANRRMEGIGLRIDQAAKFIDEASGRPRPERRLRR